MREYIGNHKFVFVSNKIPNDNKFVKLCKEVKDGAGKERIDAVLEEVTNEGRSQEAVAVTANASVRTVQMMIDDLKTFELRDEAGISHFLKPIRHTDYFLAAKIVIFLNYKQCSRTIA